MLADYVVYVHAHARARAHMYRRKQAHSGWIDKKLYALQRYTVSTYFKKRHLYKCRRLILSACFLNVSWKNDDIWSSGRFLANKKRINNKLDISNVSQIANWHNSKILQVVQLIEIFWSVYITFLDVVYIDWNKNNIQKIISSKFQKTR